MSENVEELLIGWLNIQPELEGIPVLAEVPSSRPSRFITLERVGGGTDQFLDRPTVAIQAWADSRFTAALLADTVRILLGRTTEMVPVVNVEQTAYYNWPDPLSKQSRYQLTADFVVKWNHET